MPDEDPFAGVKLPPNVRFKDVGKQKYRSDDHIVMISRSLVNGRPVVSVEKMGKRNAKLLNTGRGVETHRWKEYYVITGRELCRVLRSTDPKFTLTFDQEDEEAQGI